MREIFVFFPNNLNLSFKSRLLFSYIILIVFSLVFLGIGYYYKSSDVILNNAGNTIHDLVKKGDELLNYRLDMVEESAVVMHTDEELFDFFQTGNLNDSNFCYANDKKITKILLKFFPSSQDIYSVNLVTKKFTFGQDPNFWIPKTDYSNSRIYLLGKEAKEKIKWIPTYNLLEEFYSHPKKAYGEGDDSQYVFTATRVINCSSIKNNILYKLDETKERPVLVVNFQENLLRKAFKESTFIEGSYYYVLTENSQLVSTSLPSRDTFFKNSEWLRNAYKKGSGSEYTYVNGKKMLVCFDVMNSTGWITLVYVPYDKLMKTLPDMFTYTLCLTAIIIVFAILLASLISERISLPVKKLLIGIKRVGEGKFGSKIEETGNGELTYLISKFNEMNEKIEKLIDENYQVKLKEIEAELKALNFQFNPHFLYNTLNIINWISVSNNQTQISEMIVELSEMLEYTAKKGSSLVNFKDDEKYLKNYLSIMSKRFIDKFTVQYDIASKLYDYSVPKFFLQPFIENTLIHGFEELETGGVIKISGWIEKDTRYFCIEDNGKGIDSERLKEIMRTESKIEDDSSIGVENVNMRIKLLYGKQYGVSIESMVQRGTRVTITLPVDNLKDKREASNS